MESFAADLATMVRIPLAPEHGALMRKRGTVGFFKAGEKVQEPGQPTALFHVVLDGEVEAVDPVSMGRMGAATLGQLFADLQLL